MVEDTGWRRESPPIQAGDFPDSGIQKARDSYQEGVRAQEEGDF